MDASKSEQILVGMLRDRGVDFSRPDPRVVWEVFQQFVQQPLSDPTVEEMVLFQCGEFKLEGVEQFNLDFTRQYDFSDEEGEYDHMEQVSCTLWTPLTRDLWHTQTNLWAEEVGTLPEFFARVETLPEFQRAVNYQPYTSLTVSHFEV